MVYLELTLATSDGLQHASGWLLVEAGALWLWPDGAQTWQFLRWIEA